jgi:hypothetical protein
MSAERVVVTFTGCETKPEALAKVRAWLDVHCEEQVRLYASSLLADDLDAEAFAMHLLEVRAALTRQCFGTLTRFAEILDEARDG